MDRKVRGALLGGALVVAMCAGAIGGSAQLTPAGAAPFSSWRP